MRDCYIDENCIHALEPARTHEDPTSRGERILNWRVENALKRAHATARRHGRQRTRPRPILIRGVATDVSGMAVVADAPSSLDELLQRAESQKGLGIEYRLGGGAVRAARRTCADATNTCDCSAFVCWALGIDKQGSYPYLVPPGKPVETGNQWYGTDNIWNDAVHLEVGFFQQIGAPVPGCIVVFPARRRPDGKSTPGHIGLVVRVGPAGVEALLHCSSSNFKATGDAIRKTDDTVFRNRVGLIYAWCARIAPPRPVSETRRAASTRTTVALAKPVTLCVLAKGSEGEKIRRVAETVAADNPLGRRVVPRGDASCPSEETLVAWEKNAAARGAAILSLDGSLIEVLGVAKARRATVVDRAFAAAATSARGPRRAGRRRAQRPKR
jgi:hypothetical protein